MSRIRARIVSETHEAAVYPMLDESGAVKEIMFWCSSCDPDCVDSKLWPVTVPRQWQEPTDLAFAYGEEHCLLA